MDIVFDSTALPEAERAAAWEDVTARALRPTRFRSLDSSTFAMRLQAMGLGAARLTQLTFGSLESERTPKLIRQADPELFHIALVRRGSQHMGLEQKRNVARLHAGDMVLYESSRPFCTYSHGAGVTEILVLQFPRGLLRLPYSAADSLLARPLSTDGPCRILARFLLALAEDYPRLQRSESEGFGDIAIDLVTTSLAICSGREAAGQAADNVLILQLKDFVNANLHDQNLTPAMIADAHAISLRTLHRVFQRHGLTVSSYVRERRIDRSRRNLADPGMRHLSISTIATGSGFPTAADFSRAFRKSEGMTPSEYRQATCTASPAIHPASPVTSR
jgi:AraC-like DNA-binding protein